MRLLKPILNNLAVEPMSYDTHVPGNRDQSQRAGGQLSASQRSSKLDFAGTDLMPSANGEAKVESKKGYIEIEVEFGNLQKPDNVRQ